MINFGVNVRFEITPTFFNFCCLIFLEFEMGHPFVFRPIVQTYGYCHITILSNHF